MRFITFEYLDGTKINSKDFGLFVSKFRPSPPSLRNTFDELNGRHGQIDFGASYDNRTIEFEGFFNGKTSEAYPLYRDRIFRNLARLKSFYLIDSAQPWKRWLVRLDGEWDVDKVNLSTFGEVKATFITTGQPFAETNATTLQPKVWKDGGWWWGAGISWGDDDEYIYSSTSFTVRNFGDVPVDPRQSELVIKFTGESSNLTITNTTTGDVFQYNGTTGASDTIAINGIRSLKNGLSIISSTNLKLITIEQGDNAFTVAGTTGAFTISFEFRYLYL